jgi:hypothetical protein
VIDGVTGTAAVGALLAGDLTLYIDNRDGGFSAEELARIEEAVAGIQQLVSPYGTNIYFVGSSVGVDANIVLASGTTSVLGGWAEGVLGVSTSDGQITIIDGWNWYAGADTAAIGAGQYDFQTVITHEISHSLGLGHHGDSVSVMFPHLTTTDTRRTLRFADLNTTGEDGGAGVHVEALYAAGHNTSVETTAKAHETAGAIPTELYLDGDDNIHGGVYLQSEDRTATHAIKLDLSRTNRDYAARVDHLFSGRGLNGGFLSDSTTVFDDNAKDKFRGGKGLDWFLADDDNFDKLLALIEPDFVNKN